MARKSSTTERVTLALRLSDGTMLPVEASPDCLRFIGRYSRLSAFGRVGTRLDAHLIAQR